METLKILVVDDKHDNLAKAKVQFKNKNVTLFCCPLFSVAIELIKKHRFDVVLTDLMIPGEPDGVSNTNPEIGKEVPYGLIIAAFAKNIGVEHVAILTDISHHASPIAWAMDTLLGKRSFISVFNQSDKNWLAAAQQFMNINDVLTANTPRVRQTVVMAGYTNENYKLELKKGLEKTYEVISLSRVEDVLCYFVEHEPDHTLLFGEIDEEAADAEEFYQAPLYKKLLALKAGHQKVFAAGFFDSKDPCYLRLPFTPTELTDAFAK